MDVSNLMASVLSVSLHVLRPMISSKVNTPPTSRNSVRKLRRRRRRRRRRKR